MLGTLGFIFIVTTFDVRAENTGQIYWPNLYESEKIRFGARKNANPPLRNFTEREQIEGNRLIREFASARQKLSDLPPCEQQTRLKELILSYEPSRSCPKTREIYERAYRAGIFAEERCQKISKNLSSVFTEGLTCPREFDFRCTRFDILTLRGNFKEPMNDIIGEYLDDYSFLEELNGPKNEGEFAGIRCAIFPFLMKDFWESSIEFDDEHLAQAAEFAESACDVNFDPTNESTYHDFLRFGRKGNPALKRE